MGVTIENLIKELTLAQNVIDNYEQRVKADMIAMLEELQSKINEAEWHRHDDHLEEAFNQGLQKGGKIIQEKINKLRGEEEDGNDD